MKKSRLTNSLEKIFESDSASKDLLYYACNLKNDDELVSLLFEFINEELEYFREKDLFFLRNVLDTIKDLIKYKNELPKRLIKKTYEKIERLLIINKNGYNPESKKNLLVLKQKILQLENIKQKNYQKYYFMISLINKYRNLKYLQIVLNNYPELSNVKDSNDTSLYTNVLLKYIDKIEKSRINEEELEYYNNVLLIIRFSKKFNLAENEKLSILKKINDSLKNLQKNSKYYERKKSLLQDIIDFNLDIKKENIDINRIIKKYNIYVNFTDNLLDELNQYGSSFDDRSRIYITDYTISIDSINTCEIDDALTIKKLNNGNYLLGVHIANVLGYLPYNSLLVRNAISRGKNIYLPKNNENLEIISIFPLKFSAVIASLLEKERRLAHSYFFELDSSANVVNYKFLKTVIKNDNKSNYDFINKVIKDGSNDKILENSVRLLDELTYKLEDKYMKKINDKHSSRAEKIIELTTRLTNEGVANYFYENKYPFLYRVHEINKKDIGSLKNELTVLENEYSKRMLKDLHNKLKNACDCRYDTFGVHEGLKGIHYTHATSPLRRSSDLVVEHALDVCYFKKPTDKDLYSLELDVNKNKDILNYKNKEIEKLIMEYNLLNSYHKSVKKLKK